MNEEDFKPVIVGFKIQEEQLKETMEKLGSILCSTFEALIVINPEQALSVLQQMNDQLTEEKVEEIVESRNEYTKKLLHTINS